MTDNLRIWNAVSKTRPEHTKHVSQRGGFTSINASSQVMEATRQFGPIGIGWGYDTGFPIFHDNLVFVGVTLWHGARENCFGPIWGSEEWKDSKGRLDSDAAKKAETDALTKGLSRLGFNADVFLGLWDDQKYVEQRKQEVAAENAAPPATITEEQRQELVNLFELTGVAVGPILKRASETAGREIPDLRELPADEFAPIKAFLASKPSKQKAA